MQSLCFARAIVSNALYFFVNSLVFTITEDASSRRRSVDDLAGRASGTAVSSVSFSVQCRFVIYMPIENEKLRVVKYMLYSITSTYRLIKPFIKLAARESMTVRVWALSWELADSMSC